MTPSPDIRYARADDGVNIAYQVLGDGPTDLLFVTLFSNLVHLWQQPRWAAFHERLSSFARLILFDKRGTGLSDRPTELPSLERRMDDVRVVLDSVASERVTLVGSMEGGQMTALFAASHPQRTDRLVLYNTVARYVRSDEHPWGLTPEAWREWVTEVGDGWGNAAFMERHLRSIDAELASDPSFVAWYTDEARMAASPAAAAELYRIMGETDITDVLPAIRVPTLLLHRHDHRETTAYVASRIADATVVELPGNGYLMSVSDLVASEVERLHGVARPTPELETILSTALFTDIVGSTQKQAAVGDRAWKGLVTRHHAVVREALSRWRGVENDTAGDGFYATFDGPARAIRCAQEVIAAVKPLGIEVRAGVHTGECEVIDGKCAGLTVSIGARVAAHAEPSEVLVSQTVRDLVAGSGLTFEHAGEHELKGVPDRWQLYRVVA
jgi:class 3 adenylate cyclase